ncbi:hypothetical protein HHI36_020100 [Cryptolaemus montrouzieri]|uniref:Uncharacterized protein n=1 Tax=Cryptolaemus montrouzieri TaxID=559131 RepID=A0ABD2N9K6_9CUCU
MNPRNYIIKINHLKSIIKCKNDIISELKENNQLSKDEIHLMEKLEHVSTSVGTKSKHTKIKHPTKHGQYKFVNTQQQGRQVENVAKKSKTQRHVDNNDIDQLIHDRERHRLRLSTGKQDYDERIRKVVESSSKETWQELKNQSSLWNK